MKKLLQYKLKILAKLILKKYRSDVIGVTGSIGKTSAKEAIYAVLSSKFNVRRSVKNYNNEIGLPLTIIGADSPGKSIPGWIDVFIKAFGLIYKKDENYPRILVLEMGVDRPGDMEYLKSIVKLKVGVITAIGSTHLEYFGSIGNIQKEKSGLIGDLEKTDWAIINGDDEKAAQTEKMTSAKVLTFGFEPKVDVRAMEMSFSFANIFGSGERKKNLSNISGISFKLKHNGSAVPVLLPGIISYSAVYAALAATAVGVAYGINLVEISQALRNFTPPNGRMKLINGIKNTTLIDDTYNSSPQSAISALETVKQIPVVKGARKYAVLGDMLELGSYSVSGHKEVGKKVVEAKIDKLITVGERSRDTARGAKKAGMPEDDIFEFASAKEAGKFIQNRISEGDLIFVKGSQGMRMEKIVKEIMAEPLLAKELLVRQEDEWKGI